MPLLMRERVGRSLLLTHKKLQVGYLLEYQALKHKTSKESKPYCHVTVPYSGKIWQGLKFGGLVNRKTSAKFNFASNKA